MQKAVQAENKKDHTCQVSGDYGYGLHDRFSFGVTAGKHGVDTPADVDNVLRELCDEIFSEQLAGWYTDTETWPEDRSFNVFCRWFDYQHHSMLVDLSDEPLIAESD